MEKQHWPFGQEKESQGSWSRAWEGTLHRLGQSFVDHIETLRFQSVSYVQDSVLDWIEASHSKSCIIILLCIINSMYFCSGVFICLYKAFPTARWGSYSLLSVMSWMAWEMDLCYYTENTLTVFQTQLQTSVFLCNSHKSGHYSTPLIPSRVFHITSPLLLWQSTWKSQPIKRMALLLFSVSKFQPFVLCWAHDQWPTSFSDSPPLRHPTISPQHRQQRVKPPTQEPLGGCSRFQRVNLPCILVLAVLPSFGAFSLPCSSLLKTQMQVTHSNMCISGYSIPGALARVCEIPVNKYHLPD